MEEFKQFMLEQSQPFPEMLNYLGKLAQTKRYIMSALNNESLEINEYRIQQFGLREYFEAFFSSCYLGGRKPGREIYGLALKITHRDPEECVLIDDRGLNLECAREMGMRTIQFVEIGQLREDLAKLGVGTD